MEKPKQNIPSKINDFYLDENETIKLSEVVCPHCKTAMIHPRLLECWDKLRKRIGQPIIINSGYRCWEYHEKLYQRNHPADWKQEITKHSYHLKGMALDLSVPRPLTIGEFINLAQWAGFTYVYVIDSNPLDGDIHTDVRE